ncbi:MAG: putative glycolipid-binding domain-containing protein [Gemmatimonas sp.]
MPISRPSVADSRLSHILWRRIDTPGHDACTFLSSATQHVVSGCAVFRSSRKPSHLVYTVQCDASWRTMEAHVHGRIGKVEIDTRISRTARGIWKRDGRAQPLLDGCDDIDLAFTPATNTIALRRLALRVGNSASVRAAWLNIEDEEFSVLEQTYRRTSRDQYQYFSPRFDFRARLTVNAAGVVTNYPTLWKAEIR